MDFSQVDGILHIHLDNFFILGIACLCYFLGRWIKSEIKLLQDLSIPVPFIGGLPAAIIFACLKISKTAVIVLNLNALIFQFFLTMMALMGSWKLIKTGFVISIMFWSLAMVLGVLQALIGLTAAQALGLHQHLGLLMGTLSMMGGTETLTNFIPAVEHLDKFPGAAQAAMGVATLGMVCSMMVSAPMGEYLIKKYSLKNPSRSEFDNARLIRSIERSNKPFYQTHTVECIKIIAICFVCMAFSHLIKQKFLADVLIPDYTVCMVCALIARNFADTTGWFSVDGLALRTLTKIFLILFILVSTCALQLDLIFDLSAPIIAVFFLELIVNFLFARFIYFNLLGKDFRGMLIAVGGLAFSMGMAANGLSNMQSLCEKYGPNTDGFLVVCVVGLILLAISNTLLIKFLLTIFEIEEVTQWLMKSFSMSQKQITKILS